jgi:hypothetical protein
MRPVRSRAAFTESARETNSVFVRFSIARIVVADSAGRSYGPTAEEAVPSLPVLWKAIRAFSFQ